MSWRAAWGGRMMIETPAYALILFGVGLIAYINEIFPLLAEERKAEARP